MLGSESSKCQPQIDTESTDQSLITVLIWFIRANLAKTSELFCRRGVGIGGRGLFVGYPGNEET